MAGSSSQTQRPLLSHVTSDVYFDDAPFSPRSAKSDRTWKQFFVGDLDAGYIFQPLSAYGRNRPAGRHLRFVPVEGFVPLLLNILLGIQHMGAAFGPVLVPPLMLSGAFPTSNFGQYVIQAAFIIAGIGSLVQCLHIQIPGTPYAIGTGMCSFLGNSLVFATMYLSLIWKIHMEDGVSLEDAYGKVLGTTAVCSLVFLGLTLIPRNYVKVLFPPVVTGCIVVLVGLDSFSRGVKYWGGGPDCVDDPTTICHYNGNVQLPYGSPEYLGLGFMVVVLLVVVSLFGTAFMRQNSICMAVAIPYILAMIVTRDGKHYVSGDYFDEAETVNFLWTTTYSLGVHKSAVLPVLGAYLVSYLHATAVLTATVEESKLDVSGREENRRVQGGLVATGLVSLFSVLATGMPVVPIAENNSFIHTSRVASRLPGVAGAAVLLIFGIFGHALATTMELPVVLKGGIVVPLAAIVILSGVRILMREKWNERTMNIVLYSLVFGLGNLLVDHFVDFSLWPLGADVNDGIQSFRFAVISMMKVPYFMGGIAAITLHLILPEEMEIGEGEILPEQEKEIHISQAED